mmetsp:Transcript_26675/g.89771  ORF Transcript_26675/g.89771 Transcript_26675/m.89771 type:complete len:165 (+) Transcript_26675:74-568(+)
MGSKLEFKVVGASGADPDFPADELNRHSPHTRGWQSARFCDYPQEVVLELRARSCLRQVQILSHQHKIATRVELFVGAGARGPGGLVPVSFLFCRPSRVRRRQARRGLVLRRTGLVAAVAARALLAALFALCLGTPSESWRLRHVRRRRAADVVAGRVLVEGPP